MPAELIYRMERCDPYPTSSNDFLLVESMAQALPVLPHLIEERGFAGTARLLGKLILHRCSYILTREMGETVSTGVLSFGYCRHYVVSPGSVIIGEIATKASSRGRGLATRTIMLGINEMIRRGLYVFYIDTQKNNLPMIRSIEKLGFGVPLARS
jgi:RimJ/RimL family protein N-acetyltransferase